MLAAVNEAFSRQRSMEWYSWKHVEGPWGPSRGWVALDAGEVVGTRLFVPWRLRSPAGEHDCSRAMDGATVPRARRRGIFSTLIRAEMALLSRSHRWHCLYSTSVPASREAYRKLGWTVFPPTRVAYALSGALRRRDLQLDVPLSDLPSRSVGWLATDWAAPSLQWRMDRRSGHTYRTALLPGDLPEGLVFRTVDRRGLRVLVPVHIAAASGDGHRVVHAAAAATRSAAVLHSPAPDRRTPLLSRAGAGSTVSLWHNAHTSGSPWVDPADARQWVFDQADLEGAL